MDKQPSSEILGIDVPRWLIVLAEGFIGAGLLLHGIPRLLSIEGAIETGAGALIGADAIRRATNQPRS